MAERELEVARRQDRPGALIFTDLDGLKRCNNTHGHAAGDNLLVAAAEVLKSVFRKTDIIARLGGDEFVVLANETRTGLDDMLTRLRTAAAAREMNGLSFSLGVVPFSASGSLEQLIAQADRAMYADKLARRAAPRSAAACYADAARSGLKPSRHWCRGVLRLERSQTRMTRACANGLLASADV